MSLITPQLGPHLMRGAASGAGPLFSYGPSSDPLLFGSAWISGGLKVVRGGNLVHPRERLVNSDLTNWTAVSGATIDDAQTFSARQTNDIVQVTNGPFMVLLLEGQWFQTGVEMMLLTDPEGDNTDFRLRMFDGASNIFNQVRTLVLNEWVAFESAGHAWRDGTSATLAMLKATANASKPLQVRIRSLRHYRINNENPAYVLPGTGIVYAPPETDITNIRGLEYQQIIAADTTNNILRGAVEGPGDSGGALPTGWALTGVPASAWNVTRLRGRAGEIDISLNYIDVGPATIDLTFASGLALAVGEAGAAQVFTRLHNDQAATEFALVAVESGSGTVHKTVLGQLTESFASLKGVEFTGAAGVTGLAYGLRWTLPAAQALSQTITIRMPNRVAGFDRVPTPMVPSNGTAVSIPAQGIGEATIAAYDGPVSSLMDVTIQQPAAGGNKRLATTTNAGGTHYVQHWLTSSNNNAATHELPGTTVQHNTGQAYSPGKYQRVATSWEDANRQTFVNGSRTNATTQAGTPLDLGKVRLGLPTAATLTMPHAYLHSLQVLARGLTMEEGESATALQTLLGPDGSDNTAFGVDGQSGLFLGVDGVG